VGSGEDLGALREALRAATGRVPHPAAAASQDDAPSSPYPPPSPAAYTSDSGRPQFIHITTNIGFGTPREGDRSIHHGKLTEEEAREARKRLGWDLER
jgi:hypothetical protein